MMIGGPFRRPLGAALAFSRWNSVTLPLRQWSQAKMICVNYGWNKRLARNFSISLRADIGIVHIEADTNERWCQWNTTEHQMNTNCAHDRKYFGSLFNIPQSFALKLGLQTHTHTHCDRKRAIEQALEKGFMGEMGVGRGWMGVERIQKNEIWSIINMTALNNIHTSRMCTGLLRLWNCGCCAGRACERARQR